LNYKVKISYHIELLVTASADMTKEKHITKP